jgi:hypothetical protein
MNNFGSLQDQRLHEDLLNEFIQTWGIDVTYIPRTSQSEGQTIDLLYGDDPTKAYANNYTIECYVQSVDNFEGGEMFGKFGLTVKKQARLLMPNIAWKREVQGAYLRPQEGDLIWLRNFGALFEIKYADEEYFFYDFGKGATDPQAPETGFYGFSLIIEKFRYNDEVVTTNVPEVSNVINSIAFVYNFVLESGGTGSYDQSEQVFQTSNNNINGVESATATIVNWNLPTETLQLKTISGLFVPNTYIFGANSGAKWTLASYDVLDSINHPLSDNDDVEAIANNILNWSESNPVQGDS